MDMLDEIKSFPDQFDYALGHYAKLNQPQKAAHIHLAGMGGSALPADLINDYLAEVYPGKQIRVTRDYNLPADISTNDLLICSSYSGNTEEILECLKGALKKKIPTLILTHGGTLKENAQAHQLPIIEIPTSIQPRCAVGYFFSAILFVLESAGWVQKAGDTLGGIRDFVRRHMPSCEAEGIKIARFLKDYLPIIYGPTQLGSILKIFKIKLNENAKIQAFYNVYPELNHNEMVGFTQLISKPAIVQFRSAQTHPRIGLRMDVMKKILGDKIPFFDVQLQGKNFLEEMFFAHTIADFASYYLAKEYGVDPAPVEMVEAFKKQLV